MARQQDYFFILNRQALRACDDGGTQAYIKTKVRNLLNELSGQQLASTHRHFTEESLIGP
jgi:hypothetical protein